VKITQLSRIPLTSVEAVPQPIITDCKNFPENYDGAFRLLQLALRKVIVHHVDCDTDITHADNFAFKIVATHISSLLLMLKEARWYDIITATGLLHIVPGKRLEPAVLSDGLPLVLFCLPGSHLHSNLPFW
jgi:hypothetical protein